MNRNGELLELDGATATFLNSLARTPEVPAALEAMHVAAAAAEVATAPAQQSPAAQRARGARLIPRRVTSVSLPAFASLILSAKGAAAASAIAIATTGGLGAADLLPSQAQDAFDAVTGETTETGEVVGDGAGPSTTGATGLDRAEEVTPEEAAKGLDTARDASAKGAEKSAAGKAKAEENKAKAQERRDDAGADAAAERKAEAQQRREDAAAREDAARENAAGTSTDASADEREREDAAREQGAAREEAGRAHAPTTSDDTTDDDAAADIEIDDDSANLEAGDAAEAGSSAADAGRGRAPQR